MIPQREIQARLVRYAVTKDARDLWPEVSPSAFRAAQEEIARVARAVLTDAGSPVHFEVPPGADTRACGVAACAAGMGPLVGFWCETGRVAAPPAVADLLARHLDHGRRRAARMRHELERLLAPLADRGIEVCVLKGTHTAHRYFPEPGTRPAADIDLLVRPEDGQGARGVLRDLGFDEASSTEPERGHWTPPEPQAVRSLELAHADDPWSVDLHVSLDRTPFPGLSTGLGTPGPSRWQVWREFSRAVHTLPQPLLLAYLALHASAHFYEIALVRLIELVLVARRDFAPRSETWQAFDELVRRTSTGRFVFPALTLAEELVPGTVDPIVLEHVTAPAPRRLRRLVNEMTPASAQRLHPRPLGVHLVWAASPREVLGALVDVAWPRLGAKRLPPHQVPRVQWQRLRRAFHGSALARLARSALNRPV